MATAAVEVENLSIEFPTARGLIHAVNDAALTVQAGDILAVVGESGCGKSTLAFALLQLIPEPGRIAGGSVRVNGADLNQMDERRLQEFRGEQVSMVFQGAMDSFNPVITFYEAVEHILQSHPRVWARHSEALEYFSELLTAVHLSPRAVLRAYPHQLSGGMKQRMAIAVALLLKPAVLVLDEPTTALDVVNQRLVLDVLKRLHAQRHLTMLFVTHDLGVVAEIATHVAVMYAGRVVQWGDIDSVFYRPEQHPYVTGLLGSAPSIDRSRSEVHPIAGSVEDVFARPMGCPFEPRCPIGRPECRVEVPALLSVDATLRVRCPVVVPSSSGVGKEDPIGTVGP